MRVRAKRKCVASDSARHENVPRHILYWISAAKGGKMEEKITVTMTDEYLFDFTLYHTYSKLSGFLTNVLGLAVMFMGFIMLFMGKIQPAQLIFYLAASVIFIGYTPVLLRIRAKKQAKEIEELNCPGEYTFGEAGITVVRRRKEEHYTWEQIRKVVATPKTIGFYYGSDDALIIPKVDFGDRFVPIMTMVTRHVRPGCVRLR